MSLKQKVAFVLDFSQSILAYGVDRKIEDLYKTLMADLEKESSDKNIRTEVSLYTFGTNVKTHYKSKNVKTAQKTIRYEPSGWTALLDAVGAALKDMQNDPDYTDEETSFLVIVLTDGEENKSYAFNRNSLSQLMKTVDNTGRFTVTVHTPYSGRATLLTLGFKPYNINVWEATEKGAQEVEEKTSGGIKAFYAARSSGTRSVSNFYLPDLSFSPTTLKKNLSDVTYQFVTYGVSNSWNKKEIRDFIEKEAGRTYVKGKAFYQLTKKEKVQADKEFVVRDLSNGHTYSGKDARDLLGLPDGEIKVVPSDYTNKYEIYIESRSTNRHLVGGTKVLYREI